VTTDPLTTATLPSEGCFSNANASKAIDTKAKAARSAQNHLPGFHSIQISPFKLKKEMPIQGA